MTDTQLFLYFTINDSLVLSKVSIPLAQILFSLPCSRILSAIAPLFPELIIFLAVLDYPH